MVEHGFGGSCSRGYSPGPRLVFEVVNKRNLIGTTTLAILAASAAAVAATGSVVSGVAKRKQGRASARLAKQQAAARAEQSEGKAEVARQQAERERVVATQKEGDFRGRQRRAAAAVRAAGGARGIDISTGSALISAADFARETERQALRIREGGEIRGTRLEQQASLLSAAGRSSLEAGRIEAGAFRSAGDAAFTGSLFKAGSSLLGGGFRTARILSENDSDPD